MTKIKELIVIALTNSLEDLSDQEALLVRERFPELLEELHPPSCPICHLTMKPRIGANVKFWGCSGFPVCKGTRQFKCHSTELEIKNEDFDFDYLMEILDNL